MNGIGQSPNVPHFLRANLVTLEVKTSERHHHKSNHGRLLVSFDWTIKRLLRQKANYDVPEGFLTVLLRRQIINIPELQGNLIT